MVGNTIIIIILFSIGFQVIMLQIKQDKRHQEIKDLLKEIENKLNKLRDPQ
jgi:preprotein translocase subunit YajC